MVTYLGTFPAPGSEDTIQVRLVPVAGVCVLLMLAPGLPAVTSA